MYNKPNISLVVDTQLSEEEKISSNSKSNSNSKSYNSNYSRSSSSSSKEYDNSNSYEEESINVENSEEIKTKSYFNSTLKKNEINVFILNFFENSTFNYKIRSFFSKK